ncbi:hypothetical protein GCM10009665_08710 [Kitasatospora nipponensis]|uniref:Uncharacterized protein n=1 Tax=Kitasatospora nipponensis TaxID=258049 RepID=A0ABP4GCE9_9ACTN
MTPRRPRRIHVDGLEYRWVIQVLDPDHVAVRAWREGPGRRRQLVVSVAFSDFWLYFREIAAAGERAAELFPREPVTPGLTAALVRAGIAGGWQPEATGEPARFTMVGDRTAFALVAQPRR